MALKIKDNFALRQVAGTWVVLPLGEANAEFNGMLTLNETGLILWHLLEQGTTREAMADALTEEYEVTREQALIDVDEYLEKLGRANCIDMRN